MPREADNISMAERRIKFRTDIGIDTHTAEVCLRLIELYMRDNPVVLEYTEDKKDLYPRLSFKPINAYQRRKGQRKTPDLKEDPNDVSRFKFYDVLAGRDSEM